MMLPGVELARKRRMHNHEVYPWVPHGHNLHPRSLVRSSIPEPAMAARMRLEEKLRGTGSTTPSSPSSRWTQFLCDGSSTSRQENTKNNDTTSGRIHPIESSTQKPTVPDSNLLKRSVTEADELCDVCLEKVKGKKKVIRVPCTHK